MDIHDDNNSGIDSIDEMPDALNPTALRKFVSRARCRATFWNVLLSVLVVIVLALGGFIVNSQWTNRVGNRMTFELQQQISLKNPDLYMGPYHYSQGLLGGHLSVGTYDLIDGVPVPGPTWQFRYSVFGGLSLPGEVGDQSPAPQFSTPQGTRMFNSQTEQPIMEFYLPGDDYSQHFNDLARVNAIPSRDKVEMAISFNQDYSFREVNAMLPQGIHPSWYWVDTYPTSGRQSKYPFPYTPGMLSGTIYGFSRETFPGQSSPTQTPADFLATVESGINGPAMWRTQDQQILHILAKGNGHPTPSDVLISGIVVTGTPAKLKSLEHQDYIRASSVGAIASPF